MNYLFAKIRNLNTLRARYENWHVALLERLGMLDRHPFVLRFRDGPRLLLETNCADLATTGGIWLRGVYDPPGLWTIKPWWTVMDLGANRGIFTLYAALKAKRIIAVEANPAVMAQCIANLYINQLANRCIFVQAAVARKPGVRKLKITDGTIDSSIVRNAPSPTRRTIVVPSIALSTLVRKWAPVDLLKMDIEGSEFELMQHAVKDGWLSRVNRLVLEYHDCVPGWDCVAASRMIVAKLEGAGFRVTHVVSGRLIYAVKSGLQ